MEQLDVFDCSNVLIASYFTDDRGWIRSSQTSNCHSMIADWLNEIN